MINFHPYLKYTEFTPHPPMIGDNYSSCSFLDLPNAHPAGQTCFLSFFSQEGEVETQRAEWKFSLDKWQKWVNCLNTWPSHPSISWTQWRKSEPQNFSYQSLHPRSHSRADKWEKSCKNCKNVYQYIYKKLFLCQISIKVCTSLPLSGQTNGRKTAKGFLLKKKKNKKII